MDEELKTMYRQLSGWHACLADMYKRHANGEPCPDPHDTRQPSEHFERLKREIEEIEDDILVYEQQHVAVAQGLAYTGLNQPAVTCGATCGSPCDSLSGCCGAAAGVLVEEEPMPELCVGLQPDWPGNPAPPDSVLPEPPADTPAEVSSVVDSIMPDPPADTPCEATSATDFAFDSSPSDSGSGDFSGGDSGGGADFSSSDS